MSSARVTIKSCDCETLFNALFQVTVLVSVAGTTSEADIVPLTLVIA